MTADWAPSRGLVDEYGLYRRRRPSVTFVVKRNVITPVLFRNSYDERSETQTFAGTIRAQVNGEKFTSKERLRGLDLLRALSDKFGDENDEEWESDASEPPGGLIAPDHTYNEPAGLSTSTNLDSITYGLAGTGDQEYGLKSHVIEGYTYSTGDYDPLKKETRNAVYESGTMQNEEGTQSRALYEYAKLHPGNSFIHFVTLEAGTEGMLLYTLHNILNTGRYGARETRAGKTISNEVLGVILGDHDTSLSTGEWLLDHYDEEDGVAASIADYIEAVQRDDWDVYGDDLPDTEDFPSWYTDLEAIASRTAGNSDEILYDAFRELTEDAYHELVLNDD